jgi:ribonuclease HI
MIVQAICCEFKATNNEAEYEALIAGLNVCLSLKVKIVKIKSDSLLMVNQINGTYAAKDSKMVAYLGLVQSLLSKFDSFFIEQVPRDQNTQADALARLGSNFDALTLTKVPIVHLLEPAIKNMKLMI